MLGPDSIEIQPKRLRIGDEWCESFAVTGFPREVGPGWLAPLLSYCGRMDVALHIEPMRNDVAAGHLRRQIARLESTRRIEASRSQLPDPEIEVAAADAIDLAAGIARGDGRLFKLGLYFTVKASTPETLEAEVHKVRALAASLLMDPRPVTFRAFDGWLTTLPIGIDAIGLRRTFDTKALSSCFPFASAELSSQDGIFYGKNVSTGSLVFCDRFALENHNQVIMARSGAGKSYLAKLILLRSLYQGIDVLVVDPENEYERVAESVGGTVLRLGGGRARLNPLDLSSPGTDDALFNQVLFVHTLVKTLIGELSSTERTHLDNGLLAAYERAGISTNDPLTHNRPAPLLWDVVDILSQSPDGTSLAHRLAPFVSGSHRGLFDLPTTVRPEGHLVVFSLRDLPDELKAAGTLLALDSIWKKVSRGERKRRMVVVDEAWWLLRSDNVQGAAFLNRLAKSARKHWCGLTTITQDAADVLSSDLGQAIITNSSTQILLGQSPQAIDSLAKAFNLSEGETSYLLSCDRGQGLFCMGTERAAIRVIASDAEATHITTSPSELQEMENSQ